MGIFSFLTRRSRSKLRTIHLPSNFAAVLSKGSDFAESYSKNCDKAELEARWVKAKEAKRLALDLYTAISYTTEFDPKMMQQMDQIMVEIVTADPLNGDLAIQCIDNSTHVRSAGIPSTFLGWYATHNPKFLSAYQLSNKGLYPSPKDSVNLALAFLDNCIYLTPAWNMLDYGLTWEDLNSAQKARSVQQQIQEAFGTPGRH
jgi:hypothetical protein